MHQRPLEGRKGLWKIVFFDFRPVALKILVFSARRADLPWKMRGGFGAEIGWRMRTSNNGSYNYALKEVNISDF